VLSYKFKCRILSNVRTMMVLCSLVAFYIYYNLGFCIYYIVGFTYVLHRGRELSTD